MTVQSAFLLAVAFVLGSYLVTINLALVPNRKRPGLIWIGAVTALNGFFEWIFGTLTAAKLVNFAVAQAIVYFLFVAFALRSCLCEASVAQACRYE